MTIEVHHYPPSPDLRIEFTECPHTPCMVYYGRESATYDYAKGTGTLDDIVLNESEYKWLCNFASEAEAWYNTYRDPEA